MARCPQGHPVIIQAGGSPSGLELAARTADVVFSVVQELEPAKAAYADLKGRMAKYGRAPDELAVLPGVMPIVGDSDAEAREKLAKLQSWITPDQCRRRWSPAGSATTSPAIRSTGRSRRRRRR